MRRLSSLVVLSFILGAAACVPRYEHVVATPLRSTGGLECPGYVVWNEEPVRDVFVVINGSGNLSNAFVHPSFGELVRGKPVAYATYDKPGIGAPFGDPAAVQRDDRTFDEIATLVLSGLALEPFADILERQLRSAPDGARQREALASCDWATLEPMLGISCAYVTDASQRPSGRATFERLAARGPAARFYVFQGKHDWNTPVEPVREFEAWNAASGHLRMEFHYYDGGPTGSDAARAELERVLGQIVAAPAR